MTQGLESAIAEMEYAHGKEQALRRNILAQQDLTDCVTEFAARSNRKALQERLVKSTFLGRTW